MLVKPYLFIVEGWFSIQVFPVGIYWNGSANPVFNMWAYGTTYPADSLTAINSLHACFKYVIQKTDARLWVHYPFITGIEGKAVSIAEVLKGAPDFHTVNSIKKINKIAPRAKPSMR